MRSVWELNRLHARSKLLRERQRCLERLAHAGLDTGLGAAELVGNAEAQPVEALRGRERYVLRELERGRVAGIAAHHVAEQEGRVAPRARQRAGLVQRG